MLKPVYDGRKSLYTAGQLPFTSQQFNVNITERERYTTVARSFFSTKLEEVKDIGDGLECWRGYYQSLHPTQIYFKSTDLFNERWQSAWIIPAFWHVLSFSLLCVVCALWAPSQNSMRYAYSGDGGEDFDREETTLSLIKAGPIPPVDNRSSSNSSESKSTLSSFEVDVEEDKRE